MSAERYDALTSPNETGYAVYRRVSDGRAARAKASWFRPAPDGDGLVPRSRVKAIRLDGLNWE